MRRTPFLALILIPSLVSAAPYRSESMQGEGTVLVTLQVPAEWGDGRVTERDALALSEYSVWGFNRMLEMEGVEVTLGREAEDRMRDFWVTAWDHLDAETQAVVSLADVFWPDIRTRYETGSEETRTDLIGQFGEVMTAIWGGYEVQTVQYLAGEMSPEEYGMVLRQVVAANAGTRSGGRGSMGMGASTVDDLTSSPINYETDRVINDGTGDIEYADPN